MLRDQVVEHVREVHVRTSHRRAIVYHDERRRGSGHVLRGHIHRDRAHVIDGVRFNNQRLRVARVNRAKHIPSNPRVEAFAVLRIDHELLDPSLRHAIRHF